MRINSDTGEVGTESVAFAIAWAMLKRLLCAQFYTGFSAIATFIRQVIVDDANLKILNCLHGAVTNVTLMRCHILRRWRMPSTI